MSTDMDKVAISQLTVIINDQDIGRNAYSDIPIVDNFITVFNRNDEELIIFQHIIIGNSNVCKCRLPGWCEDKLIGCAAYISAIISCTC